MTHEATATGWCALRWPPRVAALAVVASAVFAIPASAQAVIPLDPHFSRWVRENAIPLRPVDDPYADDSYAFLRPLIGNARLLALGENIHGGHEPLAFRNHVIRYAVSQLGFTAVAIESGFTEGILIDRFIQGGPGDVDSVTRAGISYGFGELRENRELVLWLRAHNENAAHKVHFYGIDQTGVGDPKYSGATAVEAALAFLEQVDPAGAQHRSRLVPMLDRFSAVRYSQFSAAERVELRRALGLLERALIANSVRFARATSQEELALAVRNAWAALRLEQSFAVSGTEGPRALAAIRLRDSVMAENTKWILQQTGPEGRAVVFAHNGHSMNVPMTFPAMGPPMTMMGQRLRRAFGARMRIIGTASATYTGLGNVPHDMSTFEVALARAGTPNYALDLRTGDRVPAVAATLRMHWLTRLHAWFQPIVPRDVADIIVVFDKITASRER